MSTRADSTDEAVAGERPTGQGARVLAEATAALRRYTPAGWQDVRTDLLALARRAHRPSAPVRGRHDLGDFLLATDVLVGALRAAVDPVPDVTVAAVHCVTGDGERLTGVTVEVAALFGTHLPTAADTVHDTVDRALGDLLGVLRPPSDAVDVHVHVADVVTDRTAVD
ncbi:hypothetical protein [Kineococcus rhizosphaerae]|uniref:Uncharacterized protein n=1 Tax=Kineococcus rhizosphaerae TaxID=559628 RepID=A0A2T0R170_9ACTN|nr:hypothetical protein [Kineococcus rhizosphaerae]PRY13038.1 hypothetical protein CLV37_109229 [Kineococcus rhizosphaerae]